MYSYLSVQRFTSCDIHRISRLSLRKILSQINLDQKLKTLSVRLGYIIRFTLLKMSSFQEIFLQTLSKNFMCLSATLNIQTSQNCPSRTQFIPVQVICNS
jgi:hypothetical protein